MPREFGKFELKNEQNEQTKKGAIPLDRNKSKRSILWSPFLLHSWCSDLF